MDKVLSTFDIIKEVVKEITITNCCTWDVEVRVKDKHTDTGYQCLKVSVH